MTLAWTTARGAIADTVAAMCDKLLATWELRAREAAPRLFALRRSTVIEPVRSVLAAAGPALVDDAPTIPDAVEDHASQRVQVGITADVVAREYACMRAVLIDAMFTLTRSTVAREAVRAVDRVLDAWTAAAIAACLREVEAARERLVAILAHDLRSPLSCIAMVSEMLAGSAPDERAANLHAVAAGAASRMERMVTEMLELARRQSSQELPFSPTSDDLGAICRNVVAEVALANPGRSVELLASGDLRGRFDRDRVAQAITNLVRNAIEHGIGSVHVRAAEAPDQRSLVLDVMNTRAANASGPLPALTRRADGRLGFGLYIVHKIAAAHGATCSHETTSAHTTYTIRWPRAVTQP